MHQSLPAALPSHQQHDQQRQQHDVRIPPYQSHHRILHNTYNKTHNRKTNLHPQRDDYYNNNDDNNDDMLKRTVREHRNLVAKLLARGGSGNRKTLSSSRYNRCISSQPTGTNQDLASETSTTVASESVYSSSVSPIRETCSSSNSNSNSNSNTGPTVTRYNYPPRPQQQQQHPTSSCPNDIRRSSMSAMSRRRVRKSRSVPVDVDRVDQFVDLDDSGPVDLDLEAHDNDQDKNDVDDVAAAAVNASNSSDSSSDSDSSDCYMDQEKNPNVIDDCGTRDDRDGDDELHLYGMEQYSGPVDLDEAEDYMHAQSSWQQEEAAAAAAAAAAAGYSPQTNHDDLTGTRNELSVSQDDISREQLHNYAISNMVTPPTAATTTTTTSSESELSPTMQHGIPYEQAQRIAILLLLQQPSLSPSSFRDDYTADRLGLMHKQPISSNNKNYDMTNSTRNEYETDCPTQSLSSRSRHHHHDDRDQPIQTMRDCHRRRHRDDKHQGPVDVDDYLYYNDDDNDDDDDNDESKNSDSFASLEDMMIILDEIEYSREMTGYVEGFEPVRRRSSTLDSSDHHHHHHDNHHHDNRPIQQQQQQQDHDRPTITIATPAAARRQQSLISTGIICVECGDYGCCSNNNNGRTFCI